MKIEAAECDGCHRVIEESSVGAILGFLDFDFCDSVCFKDYRKSCLMTNAEVIDEELLRRANIPPQRVPWPAIDWTER